MYEWLLLKLLQSWPLLWILLQNRAYEVSGALRHEIWIFDIAFIDLLVRLLLILGLKRRSSSQELVSQDTDAPNVNRVVISVFLDHLWWQVVESTAHGLASVIWAMGAPSEVRELDSSAAVKQIFRLDISVDDLL